MVRFGRWGAATNCPLADFHPMNITLFPRALSSFLCLGTALITASWSAPAIAGTIGACGQAFPRTVLDFEGLGNVESVGSFYNNQGVSFSPNALALIDSDAGGTGDFGGEPSGKTVLFFESGESAVMNVANGFIRDLSFFYSSPDNTGIVSIYDGLNATGNILASIQLSQTPRNGAPDPTGYYSPFLPINTEFWGVGRSVDFRGATGFIGFDDIGFMQLPDPELPNSKPIPTPAMLPGLLAIGLSAWRRRQSS
jgi:hypothetical protein